LVVSRIKETATLLENELLNPFSDSEVSQIAGFIQRLECSANAVRGRVKQ
jgi:hypothetical protein